MNIRFGFVSTFPPTQCGLATFSAALRSALLRDGSDEGHVVRLVEHDEPRPAEHVVAQWIAGDQRGRTDALARLNGCDVVIMQHEFGVFGGRDGDDVLTLLAGIRVPCVVVLHTVLSQPTLHQREVLEAVAAAADAVVVMTESARARLVPAYQIDTSKVRVIAHGAPAPAFAEATRVMFGSGRPNVLTWGLLGRGKGLEWGIEAMAALRDLTPMPHYLIAGQTHPKVVLHEGEKYRDSLVARVRALALGDAVGFDNRYRDAAGLAHLLSAADIVLLPYDSTEQVTSGVLIEAVAAGKPVVATAFPHAVELLGGGAGIVVPHADPAAIAGALRTLITQRDFAATMAGIAAASATSLRWPAVAAQYRAVTTRLIRNRVAA